MEKVLAPKVEGTWILDKLTENEKLDFFVMFSSMTAISIIPAMLTPSTTRTTMEPLPLETIYGSFTITIMPTAVMESN